jgi:glutathione synthase/RimK-type ligase-like ATP-grasp enzyme
MRIGVATDVVTQDEILISNVLEDLGVGLEFIDLKRLPFKTLEDLREIFFKDFKLSVIINRATSKYIREYSTEKLERAGLKVVNPYGIEYLSNDKFRTKEVFKSYSVKTMENVLIPNFPFERGKDGKLHFNRKALEQIIEVVNKEVGFPAVLKPIAGSRGKSIMLVKDSNDLYEKCRMLQKRYGEKGVENEYALYQCLLNPYGVYVEEFVPHPLDLRVIVAKKRGERPKYLGCLGRAVVSEDTIAKNTALGGIPIGVDPPESIKSLAVKCVESEVDYARNIGYEVDYCLVGVDIVPRSDEIAEREKVYRAVANILPFKNERIEPAKAELNKVLTKFLQGNLVKDKLKDAIEEVERKFNDFKSLEGYAQARSVIENYLETCVPYANEVNTRVDYGINTKNVACENLPFHLVDVAFSALSDVS